MNDYYVYVHRRADDNLPFYVGKGHKGRAWNFYARNKFWQNTKNKHGIIVELVFENLKEDEAFQCEIDTILEFKYFGFPLTNLTAGGEGVSGYRPTEEQRKRAGIIRKNSVKFKEGTKRAAEKLRGRKHSKEHCANISRGSSGRALSEKHKQKLSDAKRTCPSAQEHIHDLVEKQRDKNVYTFYHITGEIFTGTRDEFSKHSNVDLRDVAKLFMKVGTRKSTHNWALNPIKIKVPIKNPTDYPQRRSGNVDKNVYTFYSVFAEVFTGTREEFSNHSQISLVYLAGLFCKNARKTVYGWSLQKIDSSSYTHIKI